MAKPADSKPAASGRRKAALMKEIVRLQRLLPSSDSGPRWLIYAEGKKRMESRTAPLIGLSIKAALGADPKGYFEAESSAGTGWKIGKRVDDRDW